MPTTSPAAVHAADTATAANDEPTRLAGWFDDINDSVRALLFGELVKRSQPIEHYPSDLYHDAGVRHEAPCIRRRVRDPPLRPVAAGR
jgi:hypothetical protein